MKNKKIILESLILLTVFFLSYDFSLAAGCCVKDTNANSASNCTNVDNAAACIGAFMNNTNCEQATYYCSSSPLADPTGDISPPANPLADPTGDISPPANPLADPTGDISPPLGSTKSGGGVPLPENTGLSEKTVVQILTQLLNWLLEIVGIIAIIGFVISGIMYLVSAGNEEMVTKAKKYMMYCLIGIIVALASFVVIKTIDSILNANIGGM